MSKVYADAKSALAGVLKPRVPLSDEAVSPFTRPLEVNSVPANVTVWP